MVRHLRKLEGRKHSRKRGGSIGKKFKSIFSKKKEKAEEKKEEEKKEEKEEAEEDMTALHLWGYDSKYINCEEMGITKSAYFCLLCERVCRDAVKIECKGEGISLRSFCEKCVLVYFRKHRKSKGRCPIKSHGIHKKKPSIRPNAPLRERILWLKAGCPNNAR